jgi:hypothetical protein
MVRLAQAQRTPEPLADPVLDSALAEALLGERRRNRRRRQSPGTFTRPCGEGPSKVPSVALAAVDRQWTRERPLLLVRELKRWPPLCESAGVVGQPVMLTEEGC